VIRWDEAKLTEAKWGTMRALFMGETHGTRSLFSAFMTVEPGQAVHKAHRHAEEEYMVLVEGSGRWHLDGKEVEAKKGDVVYTAPWSWHGLTNTSDRPLTFFVVKFGAKGVAAPPKPEGSDEK
jgi:mannose-6-phosphate isomerase-like protein (cupin superfamily)